MMLKKIKTKNKTNGVKKKLKVTECTKTPGWIESRGHVVYKKISFETRET